MGIKEDYRQAIVLAKAGQFEQARALLIAHDHPKTNALLDKVNQAIASGTKQKPARRGWLMKLAGGAVLTVLICGVLFGALYLAINWNWLFGTGKQELSAIAICLYVVNFENKPCDSGVLIQDHMEALIACYGIHGRVTAGLDSNRPVWVTCLENEGVVFKRLN